MALIQGLIHTIERFSIHDGPGVRTLVVMKGCPLACRWCSSPHTQCSDPEVLYIKSRCRQCGLCIAACRQKAITGGDASCSIETDRTRCIGCGACVSVCPNRARELSGAACTPGELLCKVKPDEAFYRRSGGGITVGGGEPTQQAEFVAAFLALCRDHGFHTAMETCALSSWETLAPLLEVLDLIYMDLKHMDCRRHQEWTGAPNGIILENIRKTAQRKAMVLRIPVIPGFNDDEENVTASAKFAKTLGGNLLHLELLPYHPLGIHRYAELDRTYLLESIDPPTKTHMLQLQDAAQAIGIKVEISG